MSVHSIPVNDAPIGGRLGYQILLEESEDDAASVNLDVWDDRVNLEWRTFADAEEFLESIDTIDEITPDTRVTLYVGGGDVDFQEIETTYDELSWNEHYPEDVGSLIVSSEGEFDLYWEETKYPYTAEFTAYGDRAIDVFHELYPKTAWAENPRSDDVTAELRDIWDSR